MMPSLRKKSCELVLSSSDSNIPLNSALYNLTIEAKSEALELEIPPILQNLFSHEFQRYYGRIIPRIFSQKNVK